MSRMNKQRSEIHPFRYGGPGAVDALAVFVHKDNAIEG
jgi:hypothetical protein